MASDGLRFERKLVCRGSAAFALAQLRLHPAGFAEVYPMREVHSVYLDTTDLRMFRESGDGDYARTKVRVRWYGAQRVDAAPVWLERKKKYGQLVEKLVDALPLTATGTLGETRVLERLFADARLPAALTEALRWLRATAYVGYRRHYLLSSDGRFRATVDDELRFADARLPLDRTLPVAGPVVVELKYAPSDDDDIGELTSRLPFRVARHSKYVRAVEASSSSGYGLRL